MTKKQIFMIGIALFAALIVFSVFVSAADTTPPIVSIYLSQNNTAGAHNDISYLFTINAHLYNDESTDYTISQCQIDWGDGAGWQAVSKGTKGSWYIVSHPYTTSGTKTINYRCQNNAGLWSNVTTKHINWDSITVQILPPTTQIYLSQNNSAGSHNEYSYLTTVYAHVSNNHTYTVDECRINWNDGGGWESVSSGTKGAVSIFDHTYATSGIKTVNYECRNLQGAWSSGSVKHTNLDTIELLETTIPLIQLYTPVDGATYSSVAINGTSTQVVSWSYSLNSGASQTIGTGMDIFYDITSDPRLLQGSNTVIVYGINENGTHSRTVTFTFDDTVVPPTCTSFTYSAWGLCQPDNTQTRTILTSSPTGCIGGNPVLTQSCIYNPIDTTGPVITITSPATGTHNTHSIVVNFTASDTSGVASMWYFNGTGNTTYIPNTPQTLTLANGAYTFIFYATDTLGNPSSMSRTFTVDTSGDIIDDDDEDDEDPVVVVKVTNSTKTTGVNGTGGIINLISEKPRKSLRLSTLVVWILLFLIVIMIIAILIIYFYKLR